MKLATAATMPLRSGHCIRRVAVSRPGMSAIAALKDRRKPVDQNVARDVLLFAGADVLNSEFTGLGFVLAEDDDKGRAGAFRGFEGLLQPEALIADIDCQTLFA